MVGGLAVCGIVGLCDILGWVQVVVGWSLGFGVCVVVFACVVTFV